jgi:hypothetical protein
MKSIHIHLLILLISGAASMLPGSLFSIEGELAKDLREYLDSEGRPNDSNAERWRRLKAGGITLAPLLESELERSNGAPALYHIANIAAYILPPDEGREIVIEVMRKVDSLNVPVRYLFVDPVCKVATIDDKDLVVSFKDPDRKHNNALVAATLARISIVEAGAESEEDAGELHKEGSANIAPQVTEVPPSVALEEPESSRWPLVFAGVAVLGILLLLIRAFLRRRAS